MVKQRISAQQLVFLSLCLLLGLPKGVVDPMCWRLDDHWESVSSQVPSRRLCFMRLLTTKHPHAASSAICQCGVFWKPDRRKEKWLNQLAEQCGT